MLRFELPQDCRAVHASGDQPLAVGHESHPAPVLASFPIRDGFLSEKIPYFNSSITVADSNGLTFGGENGIRAR